jgi:sugar lactone lactonase YvrE
MHHLFPPHKEIRIHGLQVLLLMLIWNAAATAAQTTTWEMAGAADFLKGSMRGVAVSWDGLLRPGLRRTEVSSPEQPVIWSAVKAPDGTVYLGTGYRGAVYAVRPSGNTELLWNAPEPVVFALALGPDGAIYAGTSPSGKIYRLQGNTAAEYYDPKAQYIWALTVHPSGRLYAGTGPEGLIHEVTGPSVGTVYYSSGQAHITSLALDSNGQLLAGSEPNGLLYRVSQKDRASILYDSSLPEIRAIVPAADGTVYVAAMGGSLARRQRIPPASGTPSSLGTPTISTTVTVTASTGNLQQPAQLPQPTTDPSVVATPPLDSSSALYEVAGIERSAVYRITPDNLVETLWSSKEENAYDLALDGERLLVATDREGRIYAVDLKGRSSLLAQTGQGQTTQLLTADGHFLAATGNEGKLFRFDTNGVAGAEYESPVHDAQKAARWGQIHWKVQSAASNSPSVELLTRSGNSFRPDDTWSDWQAAATEDTGGRILSPNARYLQWKVRFLNDAAIERVTVAYLPQNGPPKMQSVSVSSQLKAVSNTGVAATQAAANAATSAYTITVSASGDTDTSGGPAGNTVASTSRIVEPVVQCTWQAEDPDGDTLAYHLEYRAEDEREWKTIARNLRETTYSIDGSRFADGRYYFRVTATDAADNVPDSAREDSLVSAPSIVDHGAPEIAMVSQERTGNGWTVRIRASDAVSLIRRVEMSVNAKDFVVVLPEDGISDGTRENYVITVSDDAAPEPEKSVVLRATDAAGNVGTLRLVLRAPGS